MENSFGVTTRVLPDGKIEQEMYEDIGRIRTGNSN